MNNDSPTHFEGKTALEHLKQARLKGFVASTEVHGIEMPGHKSAFYDAIKDTTTGCLVLWMTLTIFNLSFSVNAILSLFMFLLAWMIWKPARSAILGWGRLNRLHRLIEEERWEIEHNREQEKLELREMYRAKGFSGRLLEEVVDVLMSDNNRLLKVMLEEELGLTLGIHEHPLKQAMGALRGVLLSGILLVISMFIHIIATPIMGALLLIYASYYNAKLQKIKKSPEIIWTLASVFTVCLLAYIICSKFASLLTR